MMSSRCPILTHLLLVMLVAWALSSALAPPAGAATLGDLDASLSRQQWSEAAEIADEILAGDSTQSQARVKGAYALFKLGLPNSGLLFLSGLSEAEWRNIPEGQDRLAEIVLLFQKKVPLSLLPARIEQLQVSENSAYLRNEVRFAKGRDAFERGDSQAARRWLEAIPRGSRYRPQASYLLATLDIKAKRYPEAAAEFSRVFDPAPMQKSSEFWSDLNTQLTSHWGTNLQVELNADALSEATSVAELSLMGLARTAYATHDYPRAIRYYDRIPSGSGLAPRATLEKVWTLLAMGRDSDAEALAARLSVDAARFESIPARCLRALVLTDSGRTDDARHELDEFERIEKAAQDAISRFQAGGSARDLPAFFQTDFKEDHRIGLLRRYDDRLNAEMEAIHKEDQSLFPVFSRLSSELLPLVDQSRTLRRKYLAEDVRKRADDLDRLLYQARLIRIETYLEDREKLRAEFRKLASPDEAREREHDKRLADLLEKAIQLTDDLMRETGKGSPALRFRHGELLWELATAKAVLQQSGAEPEQPGRIEALRRRSLRIAEEVASGPESFPRYAEALFFSGFAEVELEEPRRGARTLRSFVLRFPRNPRTPDAYRILGDLEFDANRFAKAEEDFRKILEFPDSAAFGYALYKIGWCAYNEHSYARALLAFEKAVLWSMGGSSGTSKAMNLLRESRHDLISVYAEVGDPAKAVEYFGRFYPPTDKTSARSWLSALAEALDRLGQFEKSALIYRSLVSLEPDAADSVLYQASVVDGAYRLRRFPLALEAMRDFVSLYQSRLKTPRPGSTPEAKAEGILRGVVLGAMKDVKATDEKSDLDPIQRLDELYLKAYGAWPESEEPLYREAQLLLRQGLYPQALEAFRSHWSRFQATLKDPLREEALRNLVYILEKNEPAEASPRLTPNASEFLEYARRYEAAYPKSQYSRPIAFLIASTLFKYRMTREALSEAQGIFDANPTDTIGKEAFRDIRFARYESRNWEETYRWATELLARRNPALAAYSSDLETIREESLFLLAEQTRDGARSAGYYLRVARDPAMTRLRDKSLYNAFLRLKAAGGHKLEALAAADELQKANPGFEHLADINGARAAILQDAGDYERALPLLETLVSRRDGSPAPELTQQARLNIALIAQADGRTGRALALFREYQATREGQTPAGLAACDRGIRRIELARASEKPENPPKRWKRLLGDRAFFVKVPIPGKGSLASRLKKGGEKLEEIARSFSRLSQASEVSPGLALESFCAIPGMYEAYGDALLRLGAESGELAKELAPVATPIQAKARDLARQCLARSGEAYHDGPFATAVSQKWGWRADPALASRVTAAIGELQARLPAFDPVTVEGDEARIIELHLRDRGDLSSWYALARSRAVSGKLGLSRLTLIDALSRYPGAPALLYALAATEERIGLLSPRELRELYRAAAEKGSPAAFASMALIDLRFGNIELARSELARCAGAGILKGMAAASGLAREAGHGKEEVKDGKDGKDGKDANART